jgi:hypothetical protein
VRYGCFTALLFAYGVSSHRDPAHFAAVKITS